MLDISHDKSHITFKRGRLTHKKSPETNELEERNVLTFWTGPSPETTIYNDEEAGEAMLSRFPPKYVEEKEAPFCQLFPIVHTS